MPESNKIKIKLAGNIVRGHTVNIGELGKFLSNFQDLIESFIFIQQPNAKSAKNIKRISKIYLKEITEGSAVLNLESGQDNLQGKNPVMSAYNEAVSTVKIINNNPIEARANLNNQFILPNLRLKTEIKLDNLFTNKYEIGLWFDGGFIKPKSSMRQHISNWISIDSEIGTPQINGVLTGIETHEPHYFTIMTIAGQKIKCFYEKSIEDKLIDNYLKKPITIKGIFVGMWPYSQVSAVGKFKFKNPLKLDITFEDDVWCLKLDSLNCSGCGYNYNEALKNLEISIKEKIKAYFEKFKESELTEKAKILRKNIAEISVSD
ncbi:MAG: hypothetical protein M1331_00850 [Candidatus Marsarchaeota archaeon]|nr:hypothetical protein [Candidatus Marsarchaeota archaeon]